MTDKHPPQLPEQLPVDNTPETQRREFLKKLGKYSAFASATTVTLMTASKPSAASIGGDPPGPFDPEP